MMRNLITILFLQTLTLHLLLLSVRADCECSPDNDGIDRAKARPLKMVAILTILAGGSLGIIAPILGKLVPALRPDREVFFIVKALEAGVILSTGFVHILPNAFERLTPPCLSDHPRQHFRVAGFFASVSAVVTLAIDMLVTGYFMRSHASEEAEGGEERAVEVPLLHGTDEHAHSAVADGESTALDGHRVISRVVDANHHGGEVLEMRLLFHWMIIGISLGASQSHKTIKPLVAALSLHQFRQGLALGGYILQVQSSIKYVITMAVFFFLTPPIGIAIGTWVSWNYDEKSPMAFIVTGILNAWGSGILVYIALVDILNANSMRKRRKGCGVNMSLLLGAGLMSLLAMGT